MFSFLKIDAKDLKILLFISVISTILINLPYAYGLYIAKINNLHFLGTHIINSGDLYSYLAWISQARDGHILFESLYSTEPQVRIYFHPLFLLLGNLANLFNLSNLAIYQIARILLGVGFIFVAYGMIGQFFETRKEKLLTLIWVIFGSGLGWYFRNGSTDIWMSESITYLSLYESVLNVASLILQLSIFIKILKNWQKYNFRNSIIAAILLLLLGFIHPYYVIPVMAIISVYSIILYFNGSSGVLKNYLIFSLGLMPVLIWNLFVLNNNPIIGIWATMTTNAPSLKVLYYIMGYGFILFFGLLGGVITWYKKDSKNIFLIVWALVVIVLMYLPPLLRFQRKFSEGLQICLIILGSYALFFLMRRIGLPNFVKTTICIVIIAYTSISNFYVMSVNMRIYKMTDRPEYITNLEFSAIKWLGDESQEGDLILTAPKIGNLLPGINGNRVYIGHGDQTVNSQEKILYTSKVLSAQVNIGDQLKRLVYNEGMDFIFVDSEMRQWEIIDLKSKDYLKLVFDNKDVQIYKVEQN